MISIFAILITLLQALSDCPDDQYLYKGYCIHKSCKERIKRISTEKKSSGQKFVPIEFIGSVKGSNPFEIEIQFEDDENGLFHKDNNESCIMNQLYHHKMNFLEPIIDTSNVTSTYQNQQRKWTFAIDENNLFKDVQKDKSIYNGYYSIIFLVGQYRQLSYAFDFQAILDNQERMLETHFQGRVLDDEAGCNEIGHCIQFASSNVSFCKNTTCEETIRVATFIQGQPIYVVQQITEPGFQDWFLTDAEISISSANLVKKLRPIGTQYLKGKSIFRFSTSFISDLSSIFISSKLISKVIQGRILQTQSSHALVTGYSGNIYCIKVNADSPCPTVEEIESFNEPDCGNVDFLYCDHSWHLQGLIAIVIVIVIYF